MPIKNGNRSGRASNKSGRQGKQTNQTKRFGDGRKKNSGSADIFGADTKDEEKLGKIRKRGKTDGAIEIHDPVKIRGDVMGYPPLEEGENEDNWKRPRYLTTQRLIEQQANDSLSQRIALQRFPTSPLKIGGETVIYYVPTEKLFSTEYERHDPEQIPQIEEDMKIGTPFPPIAVWDQQYIYQEEVGFPIIDGHHRHAAAKRAGIQYVPIILYIDEDQE